MQTFFRACNIVLGVVNVALFVFWLSLARIEAAPSNPLESSYFFDRISFQITILETVFAVVAVGLAVLGFFGYQLVAERAEAKADKTAREILARLVQNRQSGQSPVATSRSDGLPTAQTLPTDRVGPEEGV